MKAYLEIEKFAVCDIITTSSGANEDETERD